MKNNLISLAIASVVIFSGCARIPVIGEFHRDIFGTKGIGKYQYLENNQRNFVFTYDASEYSHSGCKDKIDLSQLNIKLERAVPHASGRGFNTLFETNMPASFDIGTGYHDNRVCIEAKTCFDESWIKKNGFNYYHFLIGDKVITVGEIN